MKTAFKMHLIKLNIAMAEKLIFQPLISFSNCLMTFNISSNDGYSP